MSLQASRMLILLFGGAVLAGVAAPVSAEVLVLEGVTRYTGTTNIDLTNEGQIDWAYWSTRGSGLTPPLAPTNEKVGGTAIGALGVMGGGTLRGSASSNAVGRYTYTDGTTTPSATNMPLAGLIFNSNIGTSAVGKGLTGSIAGDVAADRIVTLYLGGFSSTASLGLSVGSTSLAADTSQVYPTGDPKQIAAYRVRFRPDAPGDELVFQYTASAVTDAASGHVGMEAVTVAAAPPVPEPTGAAVALGLAALFSNRRRRRAEASFGL